MLDFHRSGQERWWQAAQAELKENVHARSWPASPHSWPRPGLRPPGCHGRLFLAALAGTAKAQEYPSRPIHIVVGFTAGGGANIIARDIGQQLSTAWGQPVVIDNRSGADGTIATTGLITAPADGYTLLITVPSHVTDPYMYSQVRYDPVRSFSPISLVAFSPLVILAHPALPANDMRGVIAAARANPGKITYSSPGTGSAQHLAVELMNNLAGIQMVHVPYRGGAGALTDLLSGQVQLSILSIVQALPLIQQNQVKVLAVTTAEHSPLLPGVPTLAESGVRGYDISLWFSLLVPPQTPAPVVRLLNAEVTRVLRTPEMRARLIAQGANPIASTEGEFVAFLNGENEKWARVFRESGIRPE
jgi:tripartite-type tricarboxylate transporter receptor subunit TctC